MKTRAIWIVPVVVMLTAALLLPGCGGGGGGGVGASPTPTVQSVTVQGMVTVDNASGTVTLGAVRPRALGGGNVGFDNALVRAFHYGTGLEHRFDSAQPPRTRTDGSYTVTLPKGVDYILCYERLLLSSGKRARLSAVCPNAYDNQWVAATLVSSLVAEAMSKKMGRSLDLSETWVDNVRNSLSAISIDNTYVNLSRFTIGDNAAMIGGAIGTGLLPIDNTIIQAQANVDNLISALPRPPAMPTGVSISVGDARNTISWTAVDNATSYILYWGTDNTVTRASANNVSVTSGTSYPHSPLTNGQRYYYVVTAVNAGGESAESDPVSGMPLAVPGAPATVTVLAGNRQVSLSWDIVTGATSYNIYWSTTPPVTTSSSKIAGRTTNIYTHTGLTAWTPYYYRVAAVNANGAEGDLSAEASATPNDGTVVPTLADAKAMTADLRDTAQSLTNYRERGVTASNGVIDNAATNLKAEIDNVVVPYFQSFGTSIGSFLEPSFNAIGGFPTGGDFLWDSGGTLSFAGARTDGEWRIHTFNGLDIRLWKAYSGSLLLTPINFDVTSGNDNSLRYNGTFSGITVNSTYQMVTAATLSGSFSNNVTGTGTSQRINVSGSLSATLNGSGDITAFSVTGNFSSPYLSGTGTLTFSGRIVRAEYYGALSGTGGNNITSTASQVTFTNGTLVTRKGTLEGNFRVDLVASGLTFERFNVWDNSVNRTYLTLWWDERGGGRILVDLETGSWRGGTFGGGNRHISDPPTVSGNTWTVTLHVHGSHTGEYSRYSINIDRSNPSAPTLSGSVTKHLWVGVWQDTTNSFNGSFNDGLAFIPFPTSVNFYGKYTNADSSVPFNYIEGTITGTYLNPTNSNPFFANNYEAFTATNFPQVRFQFNGTVSTTARPGITGSIDATSGWSPAGTTGNPDSGYAYMKVSGTTNYQDGIESINGTGTVYTRLVPDTHDSGKREFEFERAILSLKNAKNVSFDLGWDKNLSTFVTTLGGSLYFHPAAGSDTTFGTVSEVAGIPRITWSDGTFESLP
mgnify:CR=1 FL=1